MFYFVLQKEISGKKSTNFLIIIGKIVRSINIYFRKVSQDKLNINK